MIPDLNDLPGDVLALHTVIAGLREGYQELLNKNQSLNAENQLLVSRNQSLISENEALKGQLALLQARRYGRSSEKLERQIEELELRIEENEAALGELEDTEGNQAGTDSNKEKPRRQKLPEHLLREEVVLNPEDKCPECGGEEFRKIGDDISETLEYVPSSFKVIRYIRPRCACINCERIVQAYAPSKGIDKGKAGAGLLSHILVQKYCNHLPLYRQSQIYEREGIEISRTTMAGWIGQCARLLEPIVQEIRKAVFSVSQIHGDDTPVKVLASGIGKTKTGRIWTYVADGRSHGDITPPAVCYFYSPDRKGIRPAEHLKGFTGVLHADAYAGYDKLYDSKEATTIEEAACWAHMRRKFHEIVVTNDKASIASSVLEQLSKIYQIEEKIRGLAPELRLQERQSESKPLVDQLFAYLNKAHQALPKKSPTAKAILYAFNNQKALLRFLDNGKLEIDNNAAERALRSIALGRKNWLFTGSDNGGHSAAAIYSIIETAKLNNINPWQYLQKLLSSIQDYNAKKISDLLPWNIILE